MKGGPCYEHPEKTSMVALPRRCSDRNGKLVCRSHCREISRCLNNLCPDDRDDRKPLCPGPCSHPALFYQGETDHRLAVDGGSGNPHRRFYSGKALGKV